MNTEILQSSVIFITKFLKTKAVVEISYSKNNKKKKIVLIFLRF